MKSSLHDSATRNDPLMQVRGLSKKYIRGGLWRRHIPVPAAFDVAFEVCRGRTLALVGASGSGKSTVARCVTRLEQPDSGQIWLEGTEIVNLSSHELRPIRSTIQMIFQDAVTSMNARFTAAEVLEEPLRLAGRSRMERRAMAEIWMKEVGLLPEWLCRPVLEFSGGQRQRLAIARALMLQPKMLVLDEALSGLDVSTQAQIANLLLDLQAGYALTYLLISHDLALVARMADTVAVMLEGRIVESGATPQVMAHPQHEATRQLLMAHATAELRFTTSAGERR
jgi:peptide/nickel transport system ATP-binding protein